MTHSVKVFLCKPGDLCLVPKTTGRRGKPAPELSPDIHVCQDTCALSSHIIHVVINQFLILIEGTWGWRDGSNS